MSDPQTIRELFEKINAIADRIDKDWIPSRSSDALVLELRGVAVAARDLMDRCKFDVLSISESGDRSTLCRSVPDPKGPDPAPRGDAEPSNTDPWHIGQNTGEGLR